MIHNLDKKQRAKLDSALTEAQSRARLAKVQETLSSDTARQVTRRRSRSSRSEATGERYANMPPPPSWWDGDTATTHNLVAMRELKHVSR